MANDIMFPESDRPKCIPIIHTIIDKITRRLQSLVCVSFIEFKTVFYRGDVAPSTIPFKHYSSTFSRYFFSAPCTVPFFFFLFFTLFLPFSLFPLSGKRFEGISYPDMVNALRMHARTASKYGQGVDYTQELLMASFDDLLFRSNHSHIEWFDASCQGVAGGEYKMTTLMFNKSIRNMCEQHGLPHWSNSDLKVLRLHMSPEGEYEPNLHGVMRAVRLFYSTNEERDQFEAARPIVSKINRLMRASKHRVVDFFVLIERDLTEPVHPKKLMAAIKHLLVGNESNDDSINFPESDATARTFDTTCGSTAGRGDGVWGGGSVTGVEAGMGDGTGFRASPTKKITPLEPLEPLSQELISRITAMQEDMQKRLYMAASSGGQTHRLHAPDASAFDNLSTATISFAMKATAGKLLLTPLPPSPSSSLSPSKGDLMGLGSTMTSPSHASGGVAGAGVGGVGGVGGAGGGSGGRDGKKPLQKGARSPKLTFNLSPSFPSKVEQRTQALVTSLKQYDQKREHNLNRLAALY